MAIFFGSTIIKYEREIKSPYPTLLLFSEFRVYLRLALSVSEVRKLLAERVSFPISLSVHCAEQGNFTGSVFTSESKATDNKEFPFD